MGAETARGGPFRGSAASELTHNSSGRNDRRNRGREHHLAARPIAAGNSRSIVGDRTPPFGGSAAAVVFQILFLPSNGGTAVEGTVPNAPGRAYRYDPDTGVLRLSQGGADGTVTALGEFHVGLDGRFYDASGNAVGRPLPDGGVVVDTTALPGYRSSSAADAEARAGSVAVTDTNEPKLCPDPSVESVVGRSERSLAYQEQITGLPRGLEVMPNGIRFDGCRESDGTMLEAKGPGFANMMNGPTDWKDWFTGRESLKDQMRRQSNVARAAGKTVEWHVAERPVAGLFRDFAATNKLSNIIVIYTPLRQP